MNPQDERVRNPPSSRTCGTTADESAQSAEDERLLRESASIRVEFGPNAAQSRANRVSSGAIAAEKSAPAAGGHLLTWASFAGGKPLKKVEEQWL